MYCMNCGQKLPDSAKFCSKCGTPIGKTAPTEDVTTFDTDNKKTISRDKALICEMCGSSSIIKNNDYYECSSCGTRYSVEAAKKLIVTLAGGSLKIDKTDEMNNYVEIAGNELLGKNPQKCLEYCDKALEIDHNQRKAWVYKTLATAMLHGTDALKACFRKTVEIVNACADDEFNGGKEEYIHDIASGCFELYLEPMKELIYRMGKDCDNYDELLKRFNELYDWASQILDISCFYSECGVRANLQVGFMLTVLPNIACFNEDRFATENDYNMYIRCIRVIGDIGECFRLVVNTRTNKKKINDQIVKILEKIMICDRPDSVIDAITNDQRTMEDYNCIRNRYYSLRGT